MVRCLIKSGTAGAASTAGLSFAPAHVVLALTALAGAAGLVVAIVGLAATFNNDANRRLVRLIRACRARE